MCGPDALCCVLGEGKKCWDSLSVVVLRRAWTKTFAGRGWDGRLAAREVRVERGADGDWVNPWKQRKLKPRLSVKPGTTIR